MMATKRFVAALTGLVLVVAACGGSSGTQAPSAGTEASAAASAPPASAAPSAAAATGSIKYIMWDANQLPGYKACADAFQAKFPGTTIDVSSLGWDDYWNGITTGLVSGTSADVFTDHLNKYPEYAFKDQLLDLNPFIQRDGVKLDIYEPGLADLWVTPDGKRYGLPKDWDTVAFFYNGQMMADAGVDLASLSSLTWNPDDGGTFEKLVAKLTIDTSGKRGDEAGFDKTKIKVYGMGNAGADAIGQVQSSFYVLSDGFKFTDKPVWGTHYNYDDPKFIAFFKWWRGVIEKGYTPGVKEITGVNYEDTFGAGKYAIESNGSWNIGSMIKRNVPKLGMFPTPIGPSGKRASIFNGLADSIPKTTKNPELAWQWVKYMASAECQDIVADKGVVFPAINTSAEKKFAQYKASGIDVTAFTVHLTDGTTSLFPITDHASDVTAIIGPVLTQILLGEADPATALPAANTEVNALFTP
jgi:multiple sugar transport system substrate-binding protein